MGWIPAIAIGVPFRMGGGTSWATYWATREPSGLTAITSDTGINLLWTNNGVADFTGNKVYISTDNITFTLKATIASIETTYSVTGLTAGTLYYFYVVAYKGSIESSATNTASTETFPDLADGNTTNRFDFTDLATLTKDAGTGEVSRWNDKLASGRDLIQAGANIKPIWSVSGVLFDGSNDYMKCAAFTLNQPSIVYAVVKQISSTNGDGLFDGNTYAKGLVYQKENPPELVAFGGSADSTKVIFLQMGQYGVIVAKFYGASSLFRIWSKIVTGNFGTGNMAGFTLGASGDNTRNANAEFKEVIVRKSDDDATFIGNLIRSLASKHDVGRFVDMFYENPIATANVGEPTLLVSDDGNTIELWVTSAAGIKYFSSTDGATFSAAQDTDVTGHQYGMHIHKENGTYYLFASLDYETIHLFTGTDKLHFTDQGEVIGKGVAGSWDTSYVANSYLAKKDGVYYLFYDGRAAPSFEWKIGVATSNNIAGPYTKYGSNPIIATGLGLGVGNPCIPRVNNDFLKTNGKYHMYFLHDNDIATVATTQSIQRAYSTDLLNWTIEGDIYNFRRYHTGALTFGDMSLVQFKGKSYAFWTVSNQSGTYHVDSAYDRRTLEELMLIDP